MGRPVRTSLGTSARVTCYDCSAPTDHTFRCDTCKEAFNEKRRAKRADWAAEGRCQVCSRVVLEENPRTGDLYSHCKVCRGLAPARHGQLRARFRRQGVSNVVT